MNQISFVPDPQRRFRLYYLVPLSYVYLFTELNSVLYLWCSAIGVIGAATRHASEEAIYGPGFEERRGLGKTAEIRRLGTLIYRDKPPHEYSAESYTDLWAEGEFLSRRWAVFVMILLAFQGALAALYVYVFVAFYRHIESLDFVGGIILFALSAYTAYAILSEIWPDASKIHYQRQFNSSLGEAISGFTANLYGDGITLEDGSYEPADAGALSLELSVDYEFGPQIHRDINRVAYSLCAVTNRSSYPIEQVDAVIKTTDDGSASFIVEGEWCQNLADGKISSTEFAKRVQASVLTQAPDDKPPGQEERLTEIR